MNRIVFWLLCSLLTGCIYDPIGECFRPIIETTAATHCKGYLGKSYPYIAMYQKEFSLGKTNSVQRWKDIVACGGKYEDWDMEYYPRNYKVKGKFYKHHGECMREKGYILLSPAQCGFMNSKKDKGKCNL